MKKSRPLRLRHVFPLALIVGNERALLLVNEAGGLFPLDRGVNEVVGIGRVVHRRPCLIEIVDRRKEPAIESKHLANGQEANQIPSRRRFECCEIHFAAA